MPAACRDRVGDPGVTLWLTEGLKKTDAGASAGLCIAGFIGVWNWLGGALADWEHIPLKHRATRIIFDSDAAENENVRLAERRLAAFTEALGARVAIKRLPPGPNGEKQGLDDYLANGGTPADLEALPDAPRSDDEDDELQRLRDRLRLVEGQRDALRAENGRLAERDELIWRALGNPEVREETAVALAVLGLTTDAKGAPTQAVGWRKVYAPAIGETLRMGEATVRRHLRRLAALGVIRKETRRAPNGKSRLWVATDPERDVLRRLAMAEPLEEAETTAAGRTRGHGGVRYECPDHPDAIVRLAPTCGVCGRRLVATHEDEGRAAG